MYTLFSHKYTKQMYINGLIQVGQNLISNWKNMI